MKHHINPHNSISPRNCLTACGEAVCLFLFGFFFQGKRGVSTAAGRRWEVGVGWLELPCRPPLTCRPQPPNASSVQPCGLSERQSAARLIRCSQTLMLSNFTVSSPLGGAGGAGCNLWACSLKSGPTETYISTWRGKSPPSDHRQLPQWLLFDDHHQIICCPLINRYMDKMSEMSKTSLHNLRWRDEGYLQKPYRSWKTTSMSEIFSWQKTECRSQKNISKETSGLNTHTHSYVPIKQHVLPDHQHWCEHN